MKFFKSSRTKLKPLSSIYSKFPTYFLYSTFSKTGRRVVNNIKANMRFADNQIVEHSDAFSLHHWSKQAFGITGVLFGWNTLFQNKVKNGAKRSLLHFMKTKSQ